MTPEDYPQRVVVTDLDISFRNLVSLMVKAAIAAIPAVLILGFIAGAIVVGIAELARDV